MKKRTVELINELKECTAIERYIEINSEQFIDCTLAEYINELMVEKGMRKIDVVKSSRLSEVYTYQIIAGMKKPDREKILCIAFALTASIEEANRLLRTGGKAELYAKSKRDSILIFALDRKLSLDETNDILFELGQDVLG